MNTRQAYVLKAAKRHEVRRVKGGARDLYREAIDLRLTITQMPLTKKGLYKVAQEAKKVLMYAQRLPRRRYRNYNAIVTAAERVMRAALATMRRSAPPSLIDIDREELVGLAVDLIRATESAVAVDEKRR